MASVTIDVEERFGPAARQWFALRVKSNCERVVAVVLGHKGFESFLPLYRRYHCWSDRSKAVDLPLFPGYVFCRMDPRLRLPALTIPGALHFVGIGKVPMPIDDAEVAAIERTVRSGLATEPWEYLEVGQLVRFEEGPLGGLEGILIESRKRCRVVVSVTLLKRSVAVEIERHWITPLGPDRRPLPLRCRVDSQMHFAAQPA